MKVVMDFRKYDGVVGGVERGVLNISRYMASKGHQVVLLPKESRLVEFVEEMKGCPNIKFIPLQVRTHVMSARNAYLDSYTIQEIAKAEKADVIHFPYTWSFPFRKQAPCILTVHDVIPLTFREVMGFFTNYFLYRPGIRTATRLNDVIATVSEFSKKDIGAKLGVPETKIKVIPNGLRQPHARDEGLEAELVARYDLEKDFILYVGGHPRAEECNRSGTSLLQSCTHVGLRRSAADHRQRIGSALPG